MAPKDGLLPKKKSTSIGNSSNIGESKMKTHKNTAILVGVLFIFALVSFMVGKAIYEPTLTAPNYLDIVYPNRVVVIFGILLEFLSALSVVLIPVLLFPILKKRYEVLALGYVCFRLFEAVLLSVAQIYKLSLVSLSQTYLNQGGVDASYFQNTGNSIKSAIYWVDHDGLIYLIVFAIGTLILNAAFYRSNLIPRWLSIWGFISGVAIIAASVMVTFDLSLVVAMILIMPIALQEQVMAIWLIVKGFKSLALASEPAE